MHKKAGKIGKLFGKHKALSSQQEFLKNTPICISVGTPVITKIFYSSLEMIYVSQGSRS